MKKLRSAIAMTIAFILILSLFACEAKTPVTDPDPKEDTKENILSIYVTSGADENSADGTIDHPYPTLEDGRDAIRALGDISATQYTEIQVVLSGRFYRSSTFELDVQDSGTADCPIIWKASEKGAVITGGIELKNTDFTSVADDPFAQYFDEAVRNKIVSVDLKQFGVDTASTAFQQYTPYEIYTMNSFFCGDTRLQLARYPDTEYMTIINPVNIQGYDWTIQYNPEYNARIDTWHDKTTVYMFGYPAVLWGADYARVTAFDTANSALSFSSTGSRSVFETMPMYWYNIPEELTVPGEYYITEDAVAYYYPLTEGEWTITYPVFRDTLVTIKADYITFDNITFEDCANYGFKATCNYMTVDGCTVRRTNGMYAASMYGTNLTVKNSEFYSCAFKGLEIRSGDTNSLTASGTVITNNYFHDFSQSGCTYCGGLETFGCKILVSHNEFAFSNHQAYTLDGHENIFEYNEIHDVCLFTDDAGAVYYGKSFSNYGNIFRYNFIHDIGGIKFGEPYYSCGSSGIYWDGGEGGQIAYNNVFLNINGQAQQASGGADTTIRDNLFINCVCSVSQPQIYYDLIFENNMNLGFELITAAQKIAQEHPEIAEAYPTILQMNNSGDKNDPWYWVVPARCTITGNVAYYIDGKQNLAYSIGDKVKQWGTVKDNEIILYEEGTQPDIKAAIAKAGFDIKFDEIGRK